MEMFADKVPMGSQLSNLIVEGQGQLIGISHGDDSFHVSHYMRFLKILGVKRPLQFTFVPSQAQETKSTAYEMLKAQSMPIQLTNTSLEDFLSSRPGHIQNCVQLIGDLNMTLADKSETELVYFALLQGMLNQTDYLLIDAPDRLLSNQELEVYIQLVGNHLEWSQKKIMVASSHSSAWHQRIQHWVHYQDNTFCRIQSPTDQIKSSLDVA